MASLAPEALTGRVWQDGAHRREVKPAGFGPRLLDMALAGSAILVLLPVLALLALMIWAQDGGSPVFVQRRVGKGGRLFRCLKLRSMVRDSEACLARHLAADPAAAAEWATTHKLRKDPRITSIGRLLRKTSLDELPQLFNVLAGSMSLVGPRPIVEQEIARYGRYFKHYCSVRPGITGLWQVSGRSNVSYRRRVVLDSIYSRDKSVGLDLMIMFRTVPAVFSQRGSY